MASRHKFFIQYYSPVEVSGLYWHFVDIVWIFLFPLLYLIGGRYGFSLAVGLAELHMSDHVVL
jgi:hypothetical protein